MKKFGINWVNLVLGILLIAVGIFFCAGNTDILTKVLFVIIGVLMIASNVKPLIDSIKANDTIDIVARVLFIVFGIMFIFYHNTALSIIVGVLFIVFPVIKIILAENKMAMFIANLPELIIGIIILIVGPSAVGHVLFVVLGIFLIVFGIFSILSSFYKQEIL